MHSRTVPVLVGLLGLSLISVPLAIASEPATAATITVAYAVGHRSVLINDYRTPALGTFQLRDGEVDHVALCIEAHQSHTTARDAYAPVPNRVDSAELDALLWWLGDGSWLDPDTATAAAALAWFYADAQRNIGVPVWANGARGFARITPVSPEPWDALPQFRASHPVGLRSGYTNIDATERRLAELHRLATALAGPWVLTSDQATQRVHLVGRARGIPGHTLTFTISSPGGSMSVTAATDAEGWATPTLPLLPDGGSVTVSVDAPGVHREWDGGGIQRMVTATTTTVTTAFDVPPLPTTTTTTEPPPTTETPTPPTTTEPPPTTEAPTPTTTTEAPTTTTTSTTVPATTEAPTTSTTTTTVEVPPATEAPSTTSPVTTSTPPTTTVPAVIESSTTTTTTTTTTVENLPPAPTSIPEISAPRSLPRTGGDGAAKLLDIADLGFVAGVALIAVTGVLPRRRERETAGR